MAKRAHSPFQWRPAIINAAAVSLLLFAASYLPADTSMAQIVKRGTFRVCLPRSRPPLVTGDPALPGFDVDLLAEITKSMELTLLPRTVSAMGADFNPRNWRLSRSQCDAIAGGIVDNIETRGFLQTLPTGVQMGWGRIGPNDLLPKQGMTVAVLPAPGLDRLMLSRVLRADQADVLLMRNAEDMTAAIITGRAQYGLADKGVTDRLAQESDGLSSEWFEAEGISRQSFALGFWKGDVELRRAFARALSAMEKSGQLTALKSKYGLPTTAPGGSI